jgi:hypothetical protein
MKTDQNPMGICTPISLPASEISHMIAWHGKIACLDNFSKLSTIFRPELDITQHDLLKFNFPENAHFGLSPFHKPMAQLGSSYREILTGIDDL